MNISKDFDAAHLNGRLFDRAVIRLSPADGGEDVRGFLQGLVTQDTALVSPDRPLWAGLLTPQGKALFDFILFADRAAPLDILLDCQAAAAEALITRLSLYRLRRKITIGLDTTLGVYWAATGAGHAACDPRLPALGHRWIAAVSDGDEDVSTAYHAHRLSLGVVEGLNELGDGQTLWLEANAAELNGVSFTKGCYVGQENTARMNWRSKVNRRLVIVPIDQADEKRQRAAYPALGLSVEHRRIEDLAELQLPAWLLDAAGQSNDMS
ncbi:YgfZ/GcvT domain-containing protein [Sphingorhabdus arenilitoris]|uniref:YgfZ/GcvT domain-containing protein n=1 Tax=Sphingorhabdus arenilitoris TaxID=1490041 RepID=A0ABV8RL33_9SPHN